ncbi:carboxymuconolactone decarboxylase family protein [Streptomyces sp. NPDC017991]|uniref:carboxymuconolactone decarboxylase family protein n=1 Tax=Streptomyces sp. NPDC017991 TaxID=3365026 RepID=UPI0037AB1CAD
MRPASTGTGGAPGRFEPLRPSELDAEQRAFHHRITDGPRGRRGDVPLVGGDGSLLGPFALMAIVPALGDPVQELGAAVRYRGELDPLVREAAILLVAAHHDCVFEWFAHEPAARRLGLDDSQLGELRDGRPPQGLSPERGQALLAVNAMLRTGSLDDGAFAETRAALGERGLAELVWLTGYYSMLALALAVFDPPEIPGPER